MPSLNYDHDHDISSSESESEQDYINMEVHDSSSFSPMFGQSNNEFEFPSFSSSSEKATTSPADDLFYMGKLLPLHLPPRLDMVQKIFQHSNFDTKTQLPEDSFVTPLESKNISPSVSCHVSRELEPREYFLECSVSFTKEKKTWAKKLIKWAKFKSLFTKTGGCADNSRNDSTPRKCNSIYTDVKPFEQIKYNKVSSFEKDEDIHGSSGVGHRRSFSGAFIMESESKNSTSTRVVFKRSNSLSGSELENPIQAAIAHCKRVPLISKST